MVKALREGFRADFKNVDFRADTVIQSPLLRRDGLVVVPLERSALRQSNKIAKQILEKFALLTSLKEPLKSIPTLDLSQPKKFSDFQAAVHIVVRPFCFCVTLV